MRTCVKLALWGLLVAAIFGMASEGPVWVNLAAIGVAISAAIGLVFLSSEEPRPMARKVRR